MSKNAQTLSVPALPADLFIGNRERLKKMLPPNSLVVLNANDIPPTNSDGSGNSVANSDLFYLTGVGQEQSMLLLYPDADDEKQRELLFLREGNPENERWEGHKLTKAEAQEKTGVRRVHWLADFPKLFHRLMCECDHVFLNTNEHKRAVIEVETREARFVADTLRRYPLHDFRRLARLMHQLRAVKSEPELALMRRACDVTGAAFERVCKFVEPGVGEWEIEAEFAHEFIRHQCRFAYQPIIASGGNSNVLHYVSNDAVCKKDSLLLLDVGACNLNYNADMTRTIPVGGRFTPRQKKVYNAVLGVMRKSIENLRPGKKVKDWQLEAEKMMEKELVDLGLITTRQIKKQDPDNPALKKYFMHGLGHPLGLDVHDVGLTTQPMQAGWVMTVEPGIYIPDEEFGIRLENNVLITDSGPVDLMAHIPVEADEIESLMAKRK